MHYKNGREAMTGDPVVFKDYNGRAQVGFIHDIVVGSTTYVFCPLGGPLAVTIGESYHAEDAFAAIENVVAAEAANPTTGPSPAGPQWQVKAANPTTSPSETAANEAPAATAAP